MDTQPKKTNWIRAIALVAVSGLIASLATLAFGGTASEAQAAPEPTETSTTLAATPTTAAPAVFELPDTDEVPTSEQAPHPADDDQDNDLPEPQQDEPADDEEPEPSPANLVAPDEVATEDDGKAHIELTNTGDEDLVFSTVDIGDAPILPAVLPTTIEGGSSDTLILQVMEGGLPMGAYEFHVTVKTTGGNETVAIQGWKGFIVIPTADLDLLRLWS